MTSEVCILGGTGYLGSLLARELTRRGIHPTTVSRASQATFSVDLRDQDRLRTLIRQQEFGTIINLAGSGVDSGKRDEFSMKYLNAELPSVLADIASTESPETFVLHVASATEPQLGGVPESDYSATKARGTRGFSTTCNKSGLPHSIAIIHNVYGPHQPRTRFVQSAITSLLSHREFNIRFPHRIRDFVYEKEAIDWLATWASRPSDAPQVFEVGTGKGTSLTEVLKAIRSEVDGTRVSPLQGDIDLFDPNPSVIALNSPGDFGWCNMSVQTGIHQTVQATQL